MPIPISKFESAVGVALKYEEEYHLKRRKQSLWLDKKVNCNSY